MKKNNLKIWIGSVVIIIIIAVVLFFIFEDKPTANQATTEPESIQDISAQDIGAGTAPISYANALVKYADRRIQLDTNCSAFPNTVTYKDNTGIMIDNRSPQALTVKVGTTFTIKPYAFKIVVLPDIYLVQKTLLVDCNAYQNVATVLVQE